MLYTQGYNDRLPSGSTYTSNITLKVYSKFIFHSLHPGESSSCCLVAYAHVNSEISSFCWFVCLLLEYTQRKTSQNYRRRKQDMFDYWIWCFHLNHKYCRRSINSKKNLFSLSTTVYQYLPKNSIYKYVGSILFNVSN